jgi:hypothetical protein
MNATPRRKLLAIFGLLALGVGGASLAWACTPHALLDVRPMSGYSGQSVVLEGHSFVPSGPVQIMWNDSPVTTVTADARGNFVTNVTIPQASPGVYYFVAIASDIHGKYRHTASFELLPPEQSTSGGDPGNETQTGAAQTSQTGDAADQETQAGSGSGSATASGGSGSSSGSDTGDVWGSDDGSSAGPTEPEPGQVVAGTGTASGTASGATRPGGGQMAVTPPAGGPLWVPASKGSPSLLTGVVPAVAHPPVAKAPSGGVVFGGSIGPVRDGQVLSSQDVLGVAAEASRSADRASDGPSAASATGDLWSGVEPGRPSLGEFDRWSAADNPASVGGRRAPRPRTYGSPRWVHRRRTAAAQGAYVTHAIRR